MAIGSNDNTDFRNEVDSLRTTVNQLATSTERTNQLLQQLLF